MITYVYVIIMLGTNIPTKKTNVVKYFWNREASSSLETIMKILTSSANNKHFKNDNEKIQNE
jgi:hypothetical protein